MNSYRIRARKLRKSKNYEQAKIIYENIWENYNTESFDSWIRWEYADTLKKLGDLDEAINICKDIYKRDRKFKYNNDLLSWCLYEKYFKNLNAKKVPQNISQLIKIGDFITNIVSQDNNSPYEKTIWKIIKLLKNQFKSDMIDKWLNRLDVNLLSDNSKTINLNNKYIELASSKEEWYYLKSKVLNNKGQYNECIKLCDEAIQCISKFHNERDIWLQKEKAECLAKLEQENQAINLLKDLLIKKDHWSIHEVIFNIHIKLKNYDEGLYHAYTAALSKDPPKSKVNLYFNIGKILETKGEIKIALIHYLFCKKVRTENGWKLKNELSNKINSLGKFHKIDEETLFCDLKSYWLNQKLKASKRFKGIITKIFFKGKSGFIKSKNNSYYFKYNSILDKKAYIKEGMEVSFSISDSFDIKKNIKTRVAIDILQVKR